MSRFDEITIEEPTATQGGQKRVLTSDERVISLLEQVVTVLKKIEYHLYIASDTELKDQDV